MGRRRIAISLALVPLWAALVGWTPDIGAPPPTPPGTPKPPSAAPRTWQSGLYLDPASREASRILYRAVYGATEGVPSGWSGNVDAGVAGDTSVAFKDATTQRINYFRALAGVPADVDHDPGYASKAQAAALIMAANGQLSHAPPKTWKHWSEAGAAGAKSSNLALADVGPGAVTSYMLDPGSNNARVGHRKWVLEPSTHKMGTGDVEAQGANKAANALYVVDLASAAFTTRDPWVAWPPRGHVPYALVFPRWSFAVAKADFSSAVVTVLRDGAPLAVTVQSRNEGPGFPAIVFIPSGFSSDGWGGMARPSKDVRFDVRVDGVVVAGKPQSFAYTVIAFDPSVPGGDAVAPTISGPSTVGVGTQAGYSFQPVPRADAYHWQEARLGGAFHDAAESGTNAWKPMTAGGYALVATPGASGGHAFRLAHPSCNDEALEIDRTFYVEAASKLRFKSKKTWATAVQVAKVQAKVEGSGAWRDLWSDAATASGSGAFADKTVSLATFAGAGVRIRFLYECGGGSYYSAKNGNGWLVDDVAVDASQIVETKEHDVAPGSTSFWWLAQKGRSLLRVRPRFLGRYWLDWGPGTVVDASGPAQPPIPPPSGPPAPPPTPSPIPPTVPTAPPTTAPTTAPTTGPTFPWPIPWPPAATPGAPPTPSGSPPPWWTGGFAWPLPPTPTTPSLPKPEAKPPTKPEPTVPATPELPWPLPLPLPSAIPIPLPTP